jgi:hypothetical protein
MLPKNISKISDFPSYLYFKGERMICKQPFDQIRLFSQKNGSNSNETMARWKGLDKIKVNLLIFSVKVQAV